MDRAGTATGGCGLWLIFWVFVWLDPTVDLSLLWAFARHDLVQIQHLAIGSLLTAAGAAEIAFGASVAIASRALVADVTLLCSGKWLHSL